MALSKVIPLGTAGQLTLSESGGLATLSLTLAEAVGGGSMAGVVNAKASIELDISALQLIDAGLQLAETKFPAAAAIIATVKALVDAEIAKV